MASSTPGTNRFSKFYGGHYSDRQWYCLCRKITTRVTAKSGPNTDQSFYKCDQNPKCRFWLWDEHEAEARRLLSTSQSSEPQTPSRFQVDSKSTVKTSKNHPISDQVLRSAARQASLSSNQECRSPASFPSPEDEDELATRVMSLLESYKIRLNSRQERKLRVLIDDYMDGTGEVFNTNKAQTRWLQTRQGNDAADHEYDID
ncbi:hypothetical protein FB567DRAFT_544301 [Paraphoma chrysanthemicola]|uniref:GRF-type domain-containing protein n=1 Tax=Paraphoma chrysanthemicola TaxID=798071 RepID=A0A8K0RJB2_9PLEO|nr:hypothetical protein FB567DRAFT_544301 [Paraphoma chrysanthemicola]